VQTRNNGVVEYINNHINANCLQSVPVKI